MTSITAVHVQGVLQRQARKGLAVFGPGNVVRIAGPSAGTNPLEPDALELKGL